VERETPPRPPSERQKGRVMPFNLISTPIASDMERACEELLDGVRSGHVTGLGVVVVVKGRRFFVDALGSMVRHPHESRGFVAELDDCLREIARKRRDTDTTI
jgi:hypothetical protein